MKLSQYFNLKLEQPSLDFIDIDPSTDIALFIDPAALKSTNDQWAEESVYLIQSFFSKILELIRQKKDNEAISLLSVLREPNETHLGLSVDKSRGRTLGDSSAKKVWESLSKSKAIQTGLIEDLEDTLLLIPGIGPDIISDVTTNLIRPKLIEYTQQICSQYDIKLFQVDSGPMWDPKTSSWVRQHLDLPIITNKKILLVPKRIVRIHMGYDVDEYYRHFILTHMQEVEVAFNTSLVHLVKGEKRVTKKDLTEKYGSSKRLIIDQTLANPQILDDYRSHKFDQPRQPLSHRQIAKVGGTSVPDWQRLLKTLRNVKVGIDNWKSYENAIEAILTPLFHPSFYFPTRQYKFNNGRKIVDFIYSNVAEYGFFRWLSLHPQYPAPKIIVECKNYGNDPKNPELDQLVGRFDPLRSKVGLLLCRKIENKELLMERCRDAAKSQQGFIIPLDDDDITTLINEVTVNPAGQNFSLIKEKFDFLIS